MSSIESAICHRFTHAGTLSSQYDGFVTADRGSLSCVHVGTTQIRIDAELCWGQARRLKNCSLEGVKRIPGQMVVQSPTRIAFRSMTGYVRRVLGRHVGSMSNESQSEHATLARRDA